MPLLKELGPNERKKNFRNLNVTDSTELYQCFYNGFFANSERLSFHVQIEKKQMPFTVIKLNTVHTGVFCYQPNNYDWITSTKNSKSRC